MVGPTIHSFNKGVHLTWLSERETDRERESESESEREKGRGGRAEKEWLKKSISSYHRPIIRMIERMKTHRSNAWFND